MSETKATTNGIIFWVDLQERKYPLELQWRDGVPKMFFMKPNTLSKTEYDELLPIFTAVSQAQPRVLVAAGEANNKYSFKIGNQHVPNQVLGSLIAATYGADSKSELNPMRLERFDDMEISNITSTGKIYVVKIRIAYIPYIAPEDVKMITLGPSTYGVPNSRGVSDEYYNYLSEIFRKSNVTDRTDKVYSYVPAAFGYPLMIARINYRSDDRGYTVFWVRNIDLLPARASQELIDEFISGHTQVGPSLEQVEAGITEGLKLPKKYHILSKMRTIPGMGFSTEDVENEPWMETKALLTDDSKNPQRYVIYYPVDGSSPLLIRYNQQSALREREYILLNESSVQDVDEFLRDYVPYNQATREWQDKYEKDNNIE